MDRGRRGRLHRHALRGAPGRDLERYRYTFALVGIGLLLLPLAPVVGRTINGARLWVRVGPVTFQPGELAKIALAIFFASYLVERRDVLGDFKLRLGELPKPRSSAPILLAWAVSLVVMLAERDLGSSLLFFALFVVMLWVATDRPFYLGTGGVLFVLGSFMSYSAFAHVKERVTVWIDPWSRASGSGFQVVQAMFALGTGGIFGTGLGLGSPQKIPAAATDFIFAAIGEELGLLGTVAVLVAFLLMVGAGLRIALRAERPFEKLLATGLTTILGVQTFIIIGGVIRLVPLTGITLPFVSYGGSSLLANYILLALLLRISHDSNARHAPGDRASRAAAAAAMNGQIRRLGIALMVLFVVLFVQLNYLQVVRAGKLANDPRNTRAVVRDFSRARGDIQTADGVVLARSVDSNDAFKLQREYPEGALFGPITGYFSFSFGTDGVERTYKRRPERPQPRPKPADQPGLFSNEPVTGTVTLSLNAKLQQVAADALGKRKGAVVALDPTTGALLALWSFPSYDPTPLAGHDQAGGAQAWTASTTTRPAAAASGLPPALPAGLDVQGGDGGGGPRPQAGAGHQELPGAAPAPPADLHQDAAQLRRRVVRRHAAQPAEGLVQHRLRPDGPRPRERRTCRPRRRRSASTSGRRSTCPAPARVDLSRRIRLRARPARRWPSRPSASRTCRPRRCRWPSSPPPSPTAA